MEYTENLGLRQPLPTEFYDVGDFNYNAYVIDGKFKEHDDLLDEYGGLQEDLSEVEEKADTAISIAKGRNQAQVFDTTEDMYAWLSDEAYKGLCGVGSNLYIVDVGVPDWWISEVLEEPDEETGYYYKIAQLETQKVDLTDIEGEIDDLKKSVSDGKEVVATAITEQGVATEADATFATMAENITAVGTAKYNAGVAATKVGTATAGCVLSGYTFTNKSGVGLTGTMTNRGAWTSTTSGSGNIPIPAGYHNGRGYVSGAGAYNAGVTAGRKFSQQQVTIPYSLSNYEDKTVYGYSSFGTTAVGIRNVSTSRSSTSQQGPALDGINCTGNTLIFSLHNWSGSAISGNLIVTVDGY